jgi:hypothetical protein
MSSPVRLPEDFVESIFGLDHLFRWFLAQVVCTNNEADINYGCSTGREILHMQSDLRDRQLAAETKAIVALAFRNGPIEAVHAGATCPTCSADPTYSHINDAEMKAIMKNAVDRMYTLLRLKREDPERYAREIALGSRYARAWDEAEEVALNGSV